MTIAEHHPPPLRPADDPIPRSQLGAALGASIGRQAAQLIQAAPAVLLPHHRRPADGPHQHGRADEKEKPADDLGPEVHTHRPQVRPAGLGEHQQPTPVGDRAI
jgi:hypothetical protein